MASLSTIVDYAISVNNKSGAIPPAPQGIKKLKESIEGMPFDLLTKSMSGIFDQLPQMLQQLIKNMGGIQNMGGTGTQQILKQIQDGTITTDQILQSFGGVTAMTAGLSSFLSSDDLKAITSIAPHANTGG